MILKAGTYDNVIRLLPPLTIDEGLLEEGLGVLDEAIAAGVRVGRGRRAGACYRRAVAEDDEDEVRRSRIGSAVRGIAIDLSPLRASRDFRRLWLGLLVSTFGYQFTLVATFIQVFRLTGSAGGGRAARARRLRRRWWSARSSGSAFLDALDRRKILIGAQLGYAVSSGALFAGALMGDPPPVADLRRGRGDRRGERDRLPDPQRR